MWNMISISIYRLGCLRSTRHSLLRGRLQLRRGGLEGLSGCPVLKKGFRLKVKLEVKMIWSAQKGIKMPTKSKWTFISLQSPAKYYHFWLLAQKKSRFKLPHPTNTRIFLFPLTSEPCTCCTSSMKRASKRSNSYRICWRDRIVRWFLLKWFQASLPLWKLLTLL